MYDLEGNQVIHRFEVPESSVAQGKGMASITVDADPNDCDNAYGYIPDLTEKRLYVYSLQQDKLWKFKHNYFGFDPLQGEFEVNGVQFEWDDGLFSIVLGNRQPDGYRTAYFHAMVRLVVFTYFEIPCNRLINRDQCNEYFIFEFSLSEFAVSTEVLQNETNTKIQFFGSDFQVCYDLYELHGQ